MKVNVNWQIVATGIILTVPVFPWRVQVLVYKDGSLPVLLLTVPVFARRVQVLVYKDGSLPVLILTVPVFARRVQVLVYKDGSLPVLILTVPVFARRVQVLVYKDGSLPVLFLCAVKFQHCPPSLRQHITNIGCRLSAASQHELLSFVPMSSLRGTFLKT